MTDSSSHDSTAGAPKRQRPRPARPRARPRPRLRRTEPGESVPEAPRPDLPTAQTGDGGDASAAPDTARTPPPAGDPARPDQSQCSSGRDYEVGYGKPPKHSRFQKGQSGNRKGRPKGAKNLSGLLNQELDTLITIQEGGRSKRVTKREVMAKRLINKGMEGDLKALLALFKLEGPLPANPASAEPASEASSLDDQAILAEFRARAEQELRSRMEGRSSRDEEDPS
jgi:hypothetical protein